MTDEASVMFFVASMVGFHGFVGMIYYLDRRRRRYLEQNHKETSLDHALHCLEQKKGYLVVNLTYFYGHFWYLETSEVLDEYKAERLMRKNVGYVIRAADYQDTQKAVREARYKERVIWVSSPD